MTTLMLAEFDAETRFRLRAQNGAGKTQRGLELLDMLDAHFAGSKGDSTALPLLLQRDWNRTRCKFEWRNAISV